MSQILDRIRPWAPTMLLVGIVTALFESVEESDLTSIVILLVALAGAALVLRDRRALTRGEVRADIVVGIRAMVRPEALNPEKPVEVTLPEYRNIKPSSRSKADAETVDHGRPLYPHPDVDESEWQRPRGAHRMSEEDTQ